MINLIIKGELVHFFEEKQQYSKQHENISFPKKKIVIESEGQEYTLSFLKDKIELLKFCRYGTVIEVNAKLKGRLWTYSGKYYSANELVCSSLLIVKNNFFNHFIEYENNTYNLEKRYIDGRLIISLINIETREKKILSLDYTFPEKKVNYDHIFISDKTDKDLLSLLENLGVLTIHFKKTTAEGLSGIVCRILILEKFENRELLFPEYEENEALKRINEKKMNLNDEIESNLYDDTDFTHYDENLDADQQSDEFWNQF
jgi:hypothetical protein